MADLKYRAMLADEEWARDPSPPGSGADSRPKAARADASAEKETACSPRTTCRDPRAPTRPRRGTDRTLAGGAGRAQAVLEALATLRAYCTDLTTRRAVEIAWALWTSSARSADGCRDCPGGPRARCAGRRARIEPAALAVSRIAAKVASVQWTATPLPLPKPARMVDASWNGKAGCRGLLIHRGAPPTCSRTQEAIRQCQVMFQRPGAHFAAGRIACVRTAGAPGEAAGECRGSREIRS